MNNLKAIAINDYNDPNDLSVLIQSDKIYEVIQIKDENFEIPLSGRTILVPALNFVLLEKKEEGSEMKCSFCNKSIEDRFISANEDTFHSECFTCLQCKKLLSEKSFTRTQDGLVCEECSLNERPNCAECNETPKDTIKCSHCEKLITESQKRFIVDDMSLHTECFVCQYGKEPLDPLNPLKIFNRKLYCDEHYYKHVAPRCDGCKEFLSQVYISISLHNFHNDCFKCKVCGLDLMKNKPMVYEKSIFCEKHCQEITEENKIKEETDKEMSQQKEEESGEDYEIENETEESETEKESETDKESDTENQTEKSDLENKAEEEIAVVDDAVDKETAVVDDAVDKETAVVDDAVDKETIVNDDDANDEETAVVDDADEEETAVVVDDADEEETAVVDDDANDEETAVVDDDANDEETAVVDADEEETAVVVDAVDEETAVVDADEEETAVVVDDANDEETAVVNDDAAEKKPKLKDAPEPIEDAFHTQKDEVKEKARLKLKRFNSLEELRENESLPTLFNTNRKEEFLAEEDFKNIFSMDLTIFRSLPLWKQSQLKKSKALM